jgi:GNAT superfamily N-acetyltransferase
MEIVESMNTGSQLQSSNVNPEIVVTDTVDEQMRAVIANGLDDFNDEVIGYGDRKALAVVIKDAVSGKTVGGALGRSSLGLLFLDLFYLPQSLRGSGLGTQILNAFEEEGRKRGCCSAVLYTLSFQAPQFYERNGWRIFGDIPCHPDGTSRVFLTKLL